MSNKSQINSGYISEESMSKTKKETTYTRKDKETY